MRKNNKNELAKLNPSAKEILAMETELNAMKEENDEILQEDVEAYVGDSVKMYMVEIGKKPLLTPEREKELGKIIKENGEDALQARNELVEANLRLVAHFAKKYLNTGMEFAEINSMGVEGLIMAANKYNYELGYRFSTYASWWIKQSITRGIDKEGSTIRVPSYMRAIVNKVGKAQKYLADLYGEAPTDEEIAMYLNLPLEKVQMAENAMHSVVSIDAKVGDDDDTTFGDFYADETALDPCDVAIKETLKADIKEALTILSEKEARIITLRYGLETGEEMTLEEVANLPEFGLTRERIRQIQDKAIRKLLRSPKILRTLKDYAA